MKKKIKESTEMVNSVHKLMETVSAHNLSGIAISVTRIARKMKKAIDKLEKENKELQTSFDVLMVRSMKVGNEYQKIVEELKKKNQEINELKGEKK